MFDDLPPDLERLHTLRVWHALWLERIDRKIAALQRRQAEEERGRRTRPERPDWIVELGIGAERTPSRSTPATATWRASGAARSAATKPAASWVRAWNPARTASPTPAPHPRRIHPRSQQGPSVQLGARRGAARRRCGDVVLTPPIVPMLAESRRELPPDGALPGVLQFEQKLWTGLCAVRCP
ncbi:hypothetical protein [Streptomyces chartreusis]